MKDIPEPDVARDLERIKQNGMVLYVCESDRCAKSRKGRPIAFVESSLGMECPYCREPMQHRWGRVRVIFEPEEPDPGPKAA